MESDALLHPAFDRLVDPQWYRREYPGAHASDVQPLDDFVAVGWREGRSPHPFFALDWYGGLATDLPKGVNPLCHFFDRRNLTGINPHPLMDLDWCAARLGVGRADALDYLLDVGLRAGFSPHPLFDAEWYLAQAPHSAFHHYGPFGHYLTDGWRQNLSPNALFDPAWSMAALPDAPRHVLDPLSRYVLAQPSQASPHPLFDQAWYVRRHPQAAKAPLSYFLDQGARAGHSPHPLFDPQAYARAAPDAAGAERGLFFHYLSVGRFQGLEPHPIVASQDYRRRAGLSDDVEVLDHFLRYGAKAGLSLNPLIDLAYLESQQCTPCSAADAFVAFVEGGDAAGVSPHPLFSPAFYRAAQSTDMKATQPPFLHYWTHGDLGDSSPHPLFDSRHYQVLNPNSERRNALWRYLESVDGLARHPHPLIDGATLGGGQPRDLVDLALGQDDSVLARLALSDLNEPSRPRRRAEDYGTLDGRVSILLPVSQANVVLLAGYVDSVKAQTWADWRLILIEDGGLTEAARRVVLDVAKLDARISKVRCRTSSAFAEAFNVGLGLADGVFIMLSTAISTSPQALAELVATMVSSKAAATTQTASGTRREALMDAFGVWSRLDFIQWCDASSLVLFRREALVRLGGLTQRSGVAAACDALLRLCAAGERLVKTSLALKVAPAALRPAEAFELATVINDDFARRGAFLRVDDHSAATPRRVKGIGSASRSMDLVLVASASGVVATPGLSLRSCVDQSVNIKRLVGPLDAAQLSETLAALSGDILIVADEALTCGGASWIEELTLPLRDPAVGIVGASLLSADGDPLTCTLMLDEVSLLVASRPWSEQGAADCQVSVPNPALMAMRRDFLESLGGLDADFESAWWALVDLAFRGAAAGWVNLLTAAGRPSIGTADLPRIPSSGLDRMLFLERRWVVDGPAPRPGSPGGLS